MRGRRTAAAVVAAAALLLSGCASVRPGAPDVSPAESRTAPPTASSSPVPTERNGDTDDTDSAASKRMYANQARLDTYDTWVRSQPGAVAHGFVEAVNDPVRATVVLLWYGHDAWRDRLVAAAPRFGVKAVTFRQWPQSLPSFEAAQQRLIAAAPRFKALGFVDSTISGIGATPQPLTMAGHFAKGADRAAITRLATEVAGQPVVVEEGGGGPA